MISIIFCGDLRYCPYLSRYTDRLDKAKSQYEVLFWNRAGLEISLNSNYKYYNKPSAEDLSKWYKLYDFWGFRAWIKKQLSISKPDGIIFLSTLSAVLLFEIARKYKKRYIFDIRDYSYENIKLFSKIESCIIRDSYFTAISSKGFKAFLPRHDYVIAHNFNRNDIIENHMFTPQTVPYRIVWNGTIRFFDYQKKYLDIFKNDPRFIMVYHGTGTDLEKYKHYCKQNGILNVVFTGAYDNKEKQRLIQDAAFLNNCYGGREGDELRFAISNRFYDGVVYRIPQIVESEGFKTRETLRLGVGLGVEPTVDLPDRLFDYYESLDSEVFNTACNKALQGIIKEDDYYIKRIDEFVRRFGRLRK